MFLLAAGLPIGLAVRALAAIAPERTEQLYSRGLFPLLRAPMTGLARVMPVSIAEIILLGLVVLLAWRVARCLRAVRRRERSLADAGAHALAWLLATSGPLTLAFLLAWGFNYQRLTFGEIAGLHKRDATVVELAALVEDLVEYTNGMRARCAEDAEGVMAPSRGWDGVIDAVGEAYDEAARTEPALAGPAPVVRRALLSPLLSTGGISGIYSPFTAEAHVNAQLPGPIRPFAACHEAAHARGFAREDEANFLAWRVSRLSGNPELAYSSALVALGYVQRALLLVDPRQEQEVMQRLDPAVRRDRQALRDFWQRTDSPLRRVAERSNDLYLKAQGERAGTRSYGHVIDLILAEWREGWD